MWFKPTIDIAYVFNRLFAVSIMEPMTCNNICFYDFNKNVCFPSVFMAFLKLLYASHGWIMLFIKHNNGWFQYRHYHFLTDCISNAYQISKCFCISADNSLYRSKILIVQTLSSNVIWYLQKVLPSFSLVRTWVPGGRCHAACIFDPSTPGASRVQSVQNPWVFILLAYACPPVLCLRAFCRPISL